MYKMGRFLFQIILIGFIVNCSSVTSFDFFEHKSYTNTIQSGDDISSMEVFEQFTVQIHTDHKVVSLRCEGYCNERNNCKYRIIETKCFLNDFTTHLYIVYGDKLLQQHPLIYGWIKNITATIDKKANWNCTAYHQTHLGIEDKNPGVNECKSNPCHAYATCTNTGGSFSCSCHEGFTGDGFTCEGPRSSSRDSPNNEETAHRAITTQRPATTNEILEYSETRDSRTSQRWVIGGIVAVLAAITITIATLYRKKFIQKTRAKNCSENPGCATEHIYERVIYGLKNAIAPNIAQRPPLPLPDQTLTPELVPNKAPFKYIHYDTVYEERFNRMLKMNPPLRVPGPRKQ